MERNPKLSTPISYCDTRFIVEVENVKEVTLAAEADLAYWQERLKEEALFPFDNHGKAELLISATDLRSMGRRTNELTIGLAVCERQAADSQDGLYLVHAFNSSRLFAWIERTFFRTPYYHGRIHLEDQIPSMIQLSDAHGLAVDIQMSGQSAPAFGRDELWQGAIFLPSDNIRSQEPGRYFVAKLAGYTDIYPYSPALDSLKLVLRKEHPVFQWLIESNLVGREWRIRRNAVHARSRTFHRA
jgi:hypothetical protein